MSLTLQDTIGVIPNAFQDDLCDTILQLYETAALEGETYQGFSGRGTNNLNVKNSIDLNLLNYSNTPAIKSLNDKICDMFNTNINKYATSFPDQDKWSGMNNFNSPTVFDVLQVQRYKQGEGHYNAWHHEIMGYRSCKRFFAILVYLNDVEEGGETEFLYAGLKVKPKKGTLVIHPAGFPYVHKGHMPITSDKTILITWLCFDMPARLADAV